MTKEITTQKDIPTHILSVKIENDEYKTFWLTSKEADIIWKNINSTDRFIQFSNTREFYPKTGAILRKITDEEKRKRERVYETNAAIIRQEQKMKKEREQKEQEIQKWIKENEKEYKKILTELKKMSDIERLSKIVSEETINQVVTSQAKAKIISILKK